MIKKGLFSVFLFLGFISLPVLADEIEPTDTRFEETSLNEEGNLSSEGEIDEKEPNTIDGPEPQPELKNGFIEEEGNIYYYVDNEKQYDQQYIDGYWYYFDPESGVMSKGFINLPNQNKKVYFNQDGRMVYGYQTIEGKGYYFNTSTGKNEYTGVVHNAKNDKWYFVRNGVGENFTGWSQSIANNKWYFTRNGILDWNFTGVAQSVANNEWYHGKKGELDWKFTGFSTSVANKRWYFSRNGKLDWDFTGLATSIADGKWYHAKNGELDWDFIGFSTSIANNKWYFSRYGKLDWDFTGLATSIADKKWYHAKNGELDWNFTGLSVSIADKNWYFSRNGRLDWNFTGVAISGADGKLYYTKNGKLDWNKNGYYKHSDGKRYNIKKGLAHYIRYVIALDPGHGGSETGTFTVGPHYEKIYNLKIAKYLQKELEKYDDVYVVMTRTTDKYVGLEERVLIAKKYDCDYFISLHLNASLSHGAYGAEVYYPNTSWKPGVSNNGKKLSQAIQNELVGLGLRNLGIKTRELYDYRYPNGGVGDYYSVIRNSKIQGFPGIIVEHLCADNGHDYYNFLNSEAKLQALAKADARGIKKALSL